VCKRGNTTLVKVKIPADLSHTGKIHWKRMPIDKCIAPIVKALQEGGIDMRGSCCGHNERNGYITLQDKRVLIIKKEESGYLIPADLVDDEAAIEEKLEGRGGKWKWNY